MRKDPLVTGQYYHVYNRGVDKRDIFMNKHDLDRFVLSVKLFNSIDPIVSIQSKRLEKIDVQRLVVAENSIEKPLVSIVCYCFNPNHFHFIVRQEVEGGISEFFKRLLGGYTKYFNEIHNRSGSLFQGRFKSNLIADDQYFLKIGPYVNMNYAVHSIPSEKSYLVLASDKEYDSGNFHIVSKDAIIAHNAGSASLFLDFYNNKDHFNDECLKTISIIRQQRGKTSLLEEDPLP